MAEIDMKTGRTAIIYARVSTKGQADAGVSIDTQIQTARKWCRDNNVKVVGEFHDDGISGTTTDRDGFADMIASIYTKRPYYLVVFDSSRLTRAGADELTMLKELLDKFRCELIYAGMGGLEGNSQAATYIDVYKAANDNLFINEVKKKTQASIDRIIAEGRHTSKSVSFAFEEDIESMPKGRVLYEPREREHRDEEGRIIKTVTKPTVIKSINDFFYLVDKGGSIETIAEMWGIQRYALSDAVKGTNRCNKERCDIPNRWNEYIERVNRARESGNVDYALFEPYRKQIRTRRAQERAKRQVDKG